MPDSPFVELYYALWSRLFGLERYARKSSPGQLSLFGEHDVSQEPRDAHGEWTSSGPQESEKLDVVPPENVATLQEESKQRPASGAKVMDIPKTMWRVWGMEVFGRVRPFGDVDFLTKEEAEALAKKPGTGKVEEVATDTSRLPKDMRPAYVDPTGQGRTYAGQILPSKTDDQDRTTEYAKRQNEMQAAIDKQLAKEREEIFARAARTGKSLPLGMRTETRRRKEGNEWGEYPVRVREIANPDGTVTSQDID